MCGAAIHGLNTLHIEGRIGGALDSLCVAFITMYPSVRHVAFQGVSKVSSICASYLASLAHIKTLHFGYGTDFTSPQPIVHLTSLLSLSTRSPDPLQYFKLPNLLELTLVLPPGSTRIDIVCFPCLRRLTIYSRFSDPKLHLEPSDYPELRSLIISHSRLRWQLSSLPKLVSITLDSSVLGMHNGTLLCAALLYRPEYCPALQQISFSKPVEWVVLFLMLERRNRTTEYVTRINTVNLPLIPFILRKPLGLLLEGRSAERPSNLELSFETARELVCDATV
jgi:hypothetical protein